MYQYLSKNYLNIIIYALVVVMAYLLSKVIVNNPGMSVSGWIFSFAPVVAVGITIAVIKISAQTGNTISSFLPPSPLNVDKRIFLVVTSLAIILGLSIIFNPFDFIMPIFIGIIVGLFLLSIYMLVNDRSIDAIGLLLISLPFITYAEFEIIRKIEFSSDWITIKIAIILLFSVTWVFVNVFMNKKPLVKGKFNALVLIFVAITLLSAVLSVDINYSLKRWLFEIVYPILFYFLIINSIRHEKDIPRFLSYLIASVFLNLTIALYYFAKYGGSNPVLDKHLLHIHFADGVLVANTLIMTIPIIIAFLAATHRKSFKLLFFTMMALGIIGLILSFARVVQVIMVIGLLAFCLIRKTRRYLIAFIAVSVLIFIFNFEKLDPYMSKFKHFTSFESIVHSSSMEKRYGGWKAALRMYKDNPMTGVGIGRFNQEYTNYGVLYYSLWASGYVPMISAHNIYLTYLAETGIPGILLLLTIFAAIVVKGFRLVKKRDDKLLFKYALLISIIMFLGNSIVDGIMFAYVKEIDKGMIFWSITAIIMSYGTLEKNLGNHLLDKGRT